MQASHEPANVPQRGHRVAPRTAIVASAACWAGFAVVAWLVRHGQTAAFDRAGLLFWRESATLLPPGPPWLPDAVRLLTAFGGGLLRNLLALAATVALLALKQRREAVLLALTVILGMLLNSAAKEWVDRPRPAIVPHLAQTGGASFPSGHSFNAAVVYISVALAFVALIRHRPSQRCLIAVAIMASITIGWSRVWLGVHYPSDVIAGWLGGAGLAFLASALPFPSPQPAAETVSLPNEG